MRERGGERVDGGEGGGGGGVGKDSPEDDGEMGRWRNRGMERQRDVRDGEM